MYIEVISFLFEKEDSCLKFYLKIWLYKMSSFLFMYNIFKYSVYENS